MFLEAVLISFLVAWLRGGRLKSDFGLRLIWLPPVAYGLQLVNAQILPAALQVPVTMVSYGLLGWFAFANLRNQGVRLILIGLMLNLLVILANGGRIPVSLESARSVGVDVSVLDTGATAKHAALGPDSRLTFLADVIPVPYPIPRVISVGDVFAILGAFLLVQDLMGKRVLILRSN